MPEAHIGTWHKARRPVLGRRQTQGVITTHALQTLAARGRHAIGWDEILEGDIPQDAIIMSWRGVDGAIEEHRQRTPCGAVACILPAISTITKAPTGLSNPWHGADMCL